MPLHESDFCPEQINVPPKLPMILKQFCKSAIRTQPYDLLKWSSAYFRALANGEEPPTKLRLEYPPACTAYGLTIGFLKVLFRQLGADYNKVLPLESILERWDYLCLDRRDSDLIIRIGKLGHKCQIKKFLSIAVGLLTRSLTETMITICELFTHEPDGGSAMIPVCLFMEIYGYLAGLRCDGAEKGSTEELCICSDRTEESAASTAIASSGEMGSAAAPTSFEMSMTTQGTEAEVENELNLPKDELPSGMTIQSFGEESEESYRHEGEASYASSGDLFSSRSKTSDYVEKIKDHRSVDKISKVQQSVDKMSKDKQSVDKMSKISQSVDKMSKTSQQTASKASLSKKSASLKKTTESVSKSESIEADSEISVAATDSTDSETNYPDVPGIGPRVLADEVAGVAIWMSECARRQGGMVGPRNIRHINCPPLEGVCFERTGTTDNLFMEMK